MAPYRRIPIVRDLEYLIAFLRGLHMGGMVEAEKAVKNVMLEFEMEKDRAVGRGKKIDETKLHLRSLISECMRMCREMGIIRKDKLAVKTEDPDVKVLMKESLHEPICRVTLTKRLLTTYSSFGDILFKIRATPSGKIYASHDREKERFAKSIERYGINVTQWSFEAARDLATQLGLMNWRMLSHSEVEQDPALGETGYVIYLVSIIVKLSELEAKNITQLPTGFERLCISSCYEQLAEKDAQNHGAALRKAKAKGYLIIGDQGDAFLFKQFEADEKQFEEALWKEYLKLSGHVPREPVYYSILRDKVCEILRISDELFDLTIRKMIRDPTSYEVKVSPGSGTLPLELVTSRKHIPPKLVSDIYMAYLLMERPGRT